jgi:hypothetical protein
MLSSYNPPPIVNFKCFWLILKPGGSFRIKYGRELSRNRPTKDLYSSLQNSAHIHVYWGFGIKMGEKSRLKAELAEVKKQNEYLKAKLENIIKERDQQLEESNLFGEPTRVSNLMIESIRCIERGEADKAKTILDIMFDKNKENYIRLFRFEDRRHVKGFYRPDEKIQYGKLIDSWLVMRYSSKELADVPHMVQEHIKIKQQEERLKYDSIWNSFNLPEMMRAHEYLITQEIFGQELHEFVSNLRSKPERESMNKNIVLKELLDAQLSASAVIRTADFGFNPDKYRFPNHGKKIVDIAELARDVEGAHFTQQELNILEKRFGLLNSQAIFSVRDGTPTNYMLTTNAVNSLLSEDFLSLDKNPAEIKAEARENIKRGLFSYDHDNLLMRSFQSDEAILGLEDYLPKLPAAVRKQQEESFVKKLSLLGEDTSRYWNYRPEEGGFRHLRKATVFVKDPCYPDPSGEFKRHHLEMAAESALKRELTATEKAGINFTKVLKLMVQAYS